MTRVALIPPYSQLYWTEGRHLQMMLPEGLDTEVYRETYLYIKSRNRLAYIILDNGMFESGKSIPSEKLIQIALEFNVNEIVMPDVKNDPNLSLRLQQQFIKKARRAGYPGSFMAVVQAEPGPNWFESAIQYIGKVHELDLPDIVLGFPRSITEQFSVLGRIELMEWTTRQYGKRYLYHMLGLSRSRPSELMAAFRQHGPQLRGCDTSAPFVYAHQGLALNDVHTKIDRLENYFDLTAEDFKSSRAFTLLKQNIINVDSWAQGLHEIGWAPNA